MNHNQEKSTDERADRELPPSDGIEIPKVGFGTWLLCIRYLL
jgi:hypothetical protein